MTAVINDLVADSLYKERELKGLYIPNKAGRKKGKGYDWEQIRTEYFASEFMAVSRFLRSYLGVKHPSGTMRKMTSGWRQQKKEFMGHVNKGISKHIDARIQRHEEDMLLGKTQLTELLLRDMRRMIRYYSKSANKEKTMSKNEIDKLEKIWKMVKIELGEATSVSHSSNESKIDIKMLLSKLSDSDNVDVFEMDVPKGEKMLNNAMDKALLDTGYDGLEGNV